MIEDVESHIQVLGAPICRGYPPHTTVRPLTSW